MLNKNINIQDITCVILSGGRATRMKGLDKGLQLFKGLPLVEHVYNRIKVQVGTVIINANRNLDKYREICTTVCADENEDYDGPLAGFMAGLELAPTPYLLTVPCDAPYVPHDLVERLKIVLMQSQAQIATVRAPENGVLRAQPVFTLMRTEVMENLQKFMTGKDKKIQTWSASLNQVFVDFDTPGDDPAAFCNINSTEELERIEKWIAKSPDFAPRGFVNTTV